MLIRRLQSPLIMDLLAPHLDELILDLGCGAGFFTYEIGKRVRCIGIDRALPRISQSSQLGRKTVFFAKADVQEIPFPSSTFDKVLLSSVLQMVEDEQALLRECRRVLRPGGTIVLSVPEGYIYATGLNRRRGELNQRFGAARGYYTRSQLVELLTRNHFLAQRVEHSPKRLGSLLYEIQLYVQTITTFHPILEKLLFLILYPLAWLDRFDHREARGCELVVQAEALKWFTASSGSRDTLVTTHSKRNALNSQRMGQTPRRESQNNLNASIQLAMDWLSHPEMRNASQEDASRGGLNAGYNSKKQSYAFVYSEITGYGISTFLNMYKWTQDKVYLRYAQEAADYLLRIQAPEPGRPEFGAVPHGMTTRHPAMIKTYWSFDNAMILHGLCKFSSFTKEKRFARAASSAGDWLLSMQLEDGSFLSRYDAKTCISRHQGALFYEDGGCLHVKNVLGLLSLAALSGDQKYLQSARRVCEWGLTLEDSEGIFWANPMKKYVFTHAHCYAVEGYLFAHRFFFDSTYLHVCERAADALIRLQNEDGSLYKRHRNRLSPMSTIRDLLIPKKAADATGQAVRIWLILYSITKKERYGKAAEKGARFLLTMQDIYSKDPRLRGGFYYDCCRIPGKTIRSNIMYTWCTQFGLSALHSFSNLQKPNAYQNMMEELF